MLQRCGALLRCETLLYWILVRCFAVLCPAFHWLLSKHTQRWKAFLLTHAVNEALFAWTAAETQRAGPQRWVSLSTVHSNVVQNVKRIKPVSIRRVDHLAWHAKWNFLKYCSSKTAANAADQKLIIQRAQINTVTLQYNFFSRLNQIIHFENIFEEGEKDIRDPHQVASYRDFHVYISPRTHTRALVINVRLPAGNWSTQWCMLHSLVVRELMRDTEEGASVNLW